MPSHIENDCKPALFGTLSSQDVYMFWNLSLEKKNVRLTDNLVPSLVDDVILVGYVGSSVYYDWIVAIQQTHNVSRACGNWLKQFDSNYTYTFLTEKINVLMTLIIWTNLGEHSNLSS